jgi:hypothetical protein
LVRILVHIFEDISDFGNHVLQEALKVAAEQGEVEQQIDDVRAKEC